MKRQIPVLPMRISFHDTDSGASNPHSFTARINPKGTAAEVAAQLARAIWGAPTPEVEICFLHVERSSNHVVFTLQKVADGIIVAGVASPAE